MVEARVDRRLPVALGWRRWVHRQPDRCAGDGPGQRAAQPVGQGRGALVQPRPGARPHHRVPLGQRQSRRPACGERSTSTATTARSSATSTATAGPMSSGTPPARRQDWYWRVFGNAGGASTGQVESTTSDRRLVQPARRDGSRPTMTVATTSSGTPAGAAADFVWEGTTGPAFIAVEPSQLGERQSDPAPRHARTSCTSAFRARRERSGFRTPTPTSSGRAATRRSAASIRPSPVTSRATGSPACSGTPRELRPERLFLPRLG